jgi:hypothetical protein
VAEGKTTLHPHGSNSRRIYRKPVRAQPVDATPSDRNHLFLEVVFMRPGRRYGLSAAQKMDIWRRWKAGESLHEIGRALGKDHGSIHFLLSQHGGIVPSVRRDSAIWRWLANERRALVSCQRRLGTGFQERYLLISMEPRSSFDILRAMKPDGAFTSRRRLLFLAGISSIPIFGLLRGSLWLNAQDKTGFPNGFDAVEAAPQGHKVLFENAIVRVLQVEVARGTKEPMHHHRWPSIFVV